MAAPTISSGDITSSGNDSAVTPFPVQLPSYSSGALIVVNLASDQNVTHTIPTTGPNGDESITTLTNSNTDAGAGGPTVSAFWFITTSSETTPTLNVTPSGAEQWAAEVVHKASGTFSSSTPVDATSGVVGSNNATDTSLDSPTWTADSAGGRVVVFGAVDTDGISSEPSGWTNAVTTSRTRLTTMIASRDAESTASESVASASWTITNDGDTNASIGYIINAPAAASSSGGIARTAKGIGRGMFRGR